jgi:hypothetical protein
MKPSPAGFLEVGSRRVFAGAVDWPGWCRSGRDEDSALEALVAYGPRYASALGRAAKGFKAPSKASAFRIVERLEGNATTDFGAPGIPLVSDSRPIAEAEFQRWVTLLQACWDAFDTAAQATAAKTLRKGPRGGGRDVPKMRAHVMEADKAYLTGLGGRFRVEGKDAAKEWNLLHEIFIETLLARARGELPDEGPRGGKRWTPRYTIRRSAWHALDHTWEIEDRANGPEV